MRLLREDEVFSEDGVPRQYSGTSQLLAVYLDVLLALRPSPLRDTALRRAFTFVETMFAAEDQDVVGLAEIQLIEGQAAWWFQQAQSFLGPHFHAALRRCGEQGWAATTAPAAPSFPPTLRLHDLSQIRPTIAGMLADEGITLADLPDVQR